MDSITIKGRIRMVCIGPDGKQKWDTGEIPNIITNVGKAAVAGLVGNTGSITAFTYLALGTSSTAVAAGDTALNAEIVDTGLERAAATVSRVTTTQTDDTLQLYKEFTATGSKTVEECGVLNAASTGVLLGHALTGTKALSNGDKLQLTYKITFA